ncbi:hypothetical protein BZG00_15345 [Salinivibrio kushneri]|uniref:Uncharacterized protein n=2 Tax=Pseudomonadota TaxID=1224 RepID=A0A922NYY8_9HYPH|nr:MULTISPECIES: hypothetical protein [Pseudomonadota]YP_008126000.1 hypothetical protein M610_gp029 [Alteromonas phage vB_AmaP_AD45-P1]AGM46966.1 hypothetical protein AD45P3_00140 [Alteromonas phage vB_AmaP_AD45-P3]AGM47083.1 hypothetical protein AD45P4_00140 [Alteromonas phage vB_AmaP_AD45-P4]AGM47199.1 hypothetical protein AD45P2_00140 [Alteromonas phage vB_AmaP_AD45-P2]AGM46847.1 hypothetical protein AD45P1_00145 [Alteromonas phage vB_AmaP_AD45-P1]KEQ05562.1 hypothetical protein GV68_0851
MKTTMIRASDELVEQLRVLKEAMEASSYQRVIKELADAKLKECRAVTRDGYLPVGTVVGTKKDGPLIIADIKAGLVYFTDGSYVVNGGKVCYNLEFLANSVEEYEGGRFGE